MTSGFALPNVGPGSDILTPADLDAEFAVLLLHRDFYCSECRQQVRRVKKRYEEFQQRNAAVISVLPEDRETAEEWQKQYHLPFPVLADEDTQLGDQFEQPTRFGLLGRLHDVIGRMPAVIVLDLRWSEPIETYAHRGDSRTDRPRIDEILEALDHAATLDADNVPGASPSIDTVPGPESPNEDDAVASRSAADAGETGQTEAVEASDESSGSQSPAESAENEGTAVLEQSNAPKPQRPLVTPTSVELPENVTLRRGTNDDVVDAMRVLQGALLDIDGSTVRDAAPDGEVLLATEGDWVVGALVMREGHIEAVAVKRERRGQGIGSALVEAAVEDEGGTVTADFRAGVRGFWKGLGFDVERDDSRFWGVRTVD